ncbi:MAG: hypothetical protein ABIH83_00580 [Candidatus Micrarchaeota archaeon]
MCIKRMRGSALLLKNFVPYKIAKSKFERLCCNEGSISKKEVSDATDEYNERVKTQLKGRLAYLPNLYAGMSETAKTCLKPISKACATYKMLGQDDKLHKLISEICKILYEHERKGDFGVNGHMYAHTVTEHMAVRLGTNEQYDALIKLVEETFILRDNKEMREKYPGLGERYPVSIYSSLLEDTIKNIKEDDEMKSRLNEAVLNIAKKLAEDRPWVAAEFLISCTKNLKREDGVKITGEIAEKVVQYYLEAIFKMRKEEKSDGISKYVNNAAYYTRYCKDVNAAKEQALQAILDEIPADSVKEIDAKIVLLLLGTEMSRTNSELFRFAQEIVKGAGELKDEKVAEMYEKFKVKFQQ